jgi:N-methylhydantoinase B
MSLDLVTREVLKNALVNITREMGAIMERTSYSSILNEGKDYSCAIFDANGDLSAEAEFVLVHLACMHFSIKACVEYFGKENFKPGDIVLHNDPYLGGSHLPDVNMIRPIFVDGKLVAFVANRAHYPDMGGLAPGSFAGEAEEIFHEGIVIPPLRLYRNDELDEQLLRFFAANVRAPKRIYADAAAQVASLRIGEDRLLRLMERYGVDTVVEGIAYLMDYGEEMMRSRIQRVPNGVYRYFDYMDDAGEDSDPVRIVLALTVKDDELIFDYTGTDPQVLCPINSPMAVTYSASYGAAKCILAPDTPLNAGMYRPMKVIAPEGCLLNPTYPHPVAAGNTNTSQRVFGVVMGALAQVVPHLVEAGEYGANSDIGLGGHNLRTGDPFVLYMMPVGGLGARPNKDGNSAVINYMGNCSSQPAEVWEAMHPFRVNRWEFRQDSAGAGRWQGGFGYDLEYQAVEQVSMLSIFTERAKVPPFGLFEGMPGDYSRYELKVADHVRHIDTKVSRLNFPDGATFTIHTAGGGGYGHPYKREPERVLDDYVDGLISREKALDVYGVAITEDGHLDLEATQEQRSASDPFTSARVPRVIETTEYGPDRTVAVSASLASRLGINNGSLLEVTNGAVPLRGWAKIDPELTGQEITLPGLFALVLGIQAGAEVKLMPL